ncbi:MAG: ABC transporter permease [Deltaproteobacteria bacterium]|nr:ABC transporter permease [Deltaproteobacteria bacterium]
MNITFIHSLGRKTIERGRIYHSMADILVHSFEAGLRLSFLNRAVFPVVIRQVYSVAVQALPIILLAGLTLGTIAVHYLLSLMTAFGAYDQIGKYLTLTMLHRTAPITTAVIILVRAGPAVVSKIALMKANNEFETLRMLGIGPVRYVFLPHMLAFGFAGPSLALTFSLIGLIGSFPILGAIHDITFNNYLDQILYSLDFRSLIILLTKPFFMSMGIALVALGYGMNAGRTFRNVPAVLIQGMMDSIGVIIFVEFVYLVVL